MKVDSVSPKEYHLKNSHNKPLGPPTDGFDLNKKKLPQSNGNGCSVVATTSASTILSNTSLSNKTSILKSLLASNVDDSISMPPEENSSGYFNSAGVIQMVMQNGNTNTNFVKTKRRKTRCKTGGGNKIINFDECNRKKLNWPKIDELDSMASNLNYNVNFLTLTKLFFLKKMYYSVHNVFL